MGSTSSPNRSNKRKIGRQTIMSTETVITLDCIEVNDQKAVQILMVTAKSQSCSTNSIAINCSTICRILL